RVGPCVRCRDQLFGIRADAVLEAQSEGVLRLAERAAFCRERAAAFLQAACPNRRAFSLHGLTSRGLMSSMIAATGEERRWSHPDGPQSVPRSSRALPFPSPSLPFSPPRR